MAEKPARRLQRPALFICDIQEKFRKAIWEYEKVIATTQKMIKAADLLSIPIYATTQNRARLGATCAELEIPRAIEHVDKIAFSMWVPAISRHFDAREPAQIVIVGIESHICVTQTAIDAVGAGHKVYVLADGVSSCNAGERGVALDRLRAEGVVVTTSESWLYECLGDASAEEFRGLAKLVKEESERTRETVGVMVRGKI